MSSPLLNDFCMTVSTLDIQHKLSMLVGTFMCDDVFWDTDIEGEETRVIVAISFHFTILHTKKVSMFKENI